MKNDVRLCNKILDNNCVLQENKTKTPMGLKDVVKLLCAAAVGWNSSGAVELEGVTKLGQERSLQSRPVMVSLYRRVSNFLRTLYYI